MPESLQRVPGMQGTILVIACYGMIIKRQSAVSLLYMAFSKSETNPRIHANLHELFKNSRKFAKISG